MSVSAISAQSAPSMAGVAGLGGLGSRPAPSDTKQAAKQFEAIIVRQLLEPVMRPVMSAMGGGDGGSGGAIYGYMLTDALAGQLTQGEGLGLAKMLETEFDGTVRGRAPTSSTALKLHSTLSTSSNRE